MSLQTQLAIKDEHWEDWNIKRILPMFNILCPCYSDQVNHVSLYYWIDEYKNLDDSIIQAILKSLDIKEKIGVLQYLGECNE